MFFQAKTRKHWTALKRVHNMRIVVLQRYYSNSLLIAEKTKDCKYEYQYLYDEHENRIVQTVLENGIAREVFISDIAYFPNSTK